MQQIKVRLRSNPDEEIIVSDAIEFINSFELAFRSGTKNEPYLKRKFSDNPHAVEIIYIENILDNHVYIADKGYICTLSYHKSRIGYCWGYSARKLPNALECSQFVEVNTALHKDYKTMLAKRISAQEQARKQREEEEKRLREETQKQIDMLRDLAHANGLNLALDYINNMDDEE